MFWRNGIIKDLQDQLLDERKRRERAEAVAAEWERAILGDLERRLEAMARNAPWLLPEAVEELRLAAGKLTENANADMECE